jgi:tetratricopeptide (TPR) repeat protein
VRPGPIRRRDLVMTREFYPTHHMLCSADMASKHWIRWLALVAGLAFVLRLVHLAEFAGTPLATVLIGDARQYDAWAQRLAAGDWLGSGVFYQAPLYPYLLGVVYAVVGHSLLAVRLIQAVLGASACALLAVAGRRLVGPRAGLIAGAMLAIYPPAIFFDGLLQKSSLDLFLAVLLLVLLGEFMAGGPEGHALHTILSRPQAARREPQAGSRPSPLGAAKDGWPWLAGAGLALGAFMLNRENARVVYPVVLAWLWFFFRAVPVRARVAWAAIFTLGVAVAVLPVGLRNAYVGGEFLISTSQAGPNFYIGNHTGASGSYVPLVAGHGNAEFERDDATRLAETATGRHLSPGEVSDYWLARAVHDIRQAPGQWLALLGRKVLLTFNAAEVVDTESIEIYANYSRVLGTRITFGMVLALAAFGAWVMRREWRRLVLLYAVAGVFALSVAVFYVVARYRYPMVPAVLLLAGAAVAQAPAAFRSVRDWVPGLAIGILVAVLAYLPIVPAADETELNMGTALISLDRAAEAAAWLERAAAAAPGYAAPHFNLGVAYKRIGENQKSKEEFEAAVRLAPADAEAQGALALARQEVGDAAGAMAAFGEAARLQPENAKAQFNFANALQAAGDAAGAIPRYEAALGQKPDYAEAHSNLALALRNTGNLTGAIEHMRAAARLQPGSEAITFNLFVLLTEAGRCQDAVDAIGTVRALASAEPGRAEMVASIDQSLRECRARAGR